MASVRPFRFTNLPRYTSDQIAVQESVARYLSTRPLEPAFKQDVEAMLESYLKAPCRLSTTELQPLSRSDVAALIPSTACLLVVGAAPTAKKLLVDLDTGIAAFAIDRLLGGSGDASRITRPLTDIEQGVLSFLVLKVLSLAHTGWSSGKELALTLDRFASSWREVQDLAATEPSYYLVGISVSAGQRMGYARVLLPQSLITESFLSKIPQDMAVGGDVEQMRKVFKTLGERSVEARVRVAQLDLGPSDLKDLQKGDIVILENHELALTPGGIQGNAFVSLGDGRNGGMRCRVTSDSDRARLEIVEVVVQQEPDASDARPEDVMADGKPEGEEDNLPETEGLLRDVPAPVVVELGRIRMNTAQVIRLRQGQVLRLPRGPNDPVDLVVNGKLFARGELIEVDGELGVRLVQVVGG